MRPRNDTLPNPIDPNQALPALCAGILHGFWHAESPVNPPAPLVCEQGVLIENGRPLPDPVIRTAATRVQASLNAGGERCSTERCAVTSWAMWSGRCKRRSVAVMPTWLDIGPWGCSSPDFILTPSGASLPYLPKIAGASSRKGFGHCGGRFGKSIDFMKRLGNDKRPSRTSTRYTLCQNGVNTLSHTSAGADRRRS